MKQWSNSNRSRWTTRVGHGKKHEVHHYPPKEMAADVGRGTEFGGCRVDLGLFFFVFLAGEWGEQIQVIIKLMNFEIFCEKKILQEQRKEPPDQRQWDVHNDERNLLISNPENFAKKTPRPLFFFRNFVPMSWWRPEGFLGFEPFSWVFHRVFGGKRWPKLWLVCINQFLRTWKSKRPTRTGFNQKNGGPGLSRCISY